LEVGAYEAKTHLPKLLERVERGERIVITRHGRPIAELVPVAGRDTARIATAIADIRSLRRALAKRGVALRGILRKGESARGLAHHGHRY